jgi:hypothetical protein
MSPEGARSTTTSRRSGRATSGTCPVIRSKTQAYFYLQPDFIRETVVDGLDNNLDASPR